MLNISELLTGLARFFQQLIVRPFLWAGFAILVLNSRAVYAEDIQLMDVDDAYPDVLVHGFGTIGAAYHDKEGVQFRRSTGQLSGARADRISFSADSMLGIQLTAQFSPELEATIQGVSRENLEGNYRAKTTWAFLKYTPNEHLFARVGRVGYDIFLGGDTADIDYSHLLVRRPVFFFPGGFDGVDAEFTYPVNDGMLHLKGYYGEEFNKRLEHVSGFYDLSGSKIYGGFVQYDWQNWSGRLSVGRLRLNRENYGLTGPLGAYLGSLPNGDKIADFISTKDRPYEHVLLALAYESSCWQGSFNYGGFFSPHWPTRVVLQTEVGYRIGDVTPYIAYSDEHMSRHIIPTGIPSGRAPSTDAINMGTALLQNAFVFNQSDISLGVRYDFARNMALKLQIDRIRYQDPDGVIDPSLMSATSSVESRGHESFTLFSAVLNFVF